MTSEECETGIREMIKPENCGPVREINAIQTKLWIPTVTDLSNQTPQFIHMQELYLDWIRRNGIVLMNSTKSR